MPLSDELFARKLARGGMGMGAAAAPALLGSALTAQKESEGVAAFNATLAGITVGGITLLSWVGLLTSSFAGPVVGNNGNTHTEHFSQAYPSPFTTYSMRGFRCYSASGGSAHDVSGTKASGTTGEVTIAAVALAGGTIVDSSTLLRAAAGAGATHTSGTVTISSGQARLVAIASGDGDVNATAPTQTWPGDWTVLQSVAFSSAQAPNGHIPLYVATKEVGPGTHSVDVQVAINEGLLMSIYAVQ